MISLSVDDFCCRLPGNGIVKTVLYHGIEIVCGRRVLVIVNTALCIDVGNLLPNTPFTGSDGTYSFPDKRVNKGTGVKSLADVLGIKPEEIMAIGDQENDIAMIEYAGVGVAMDNAIPSVKEVANFVTKSNLEDGVAFAIEKYVLN